MTALTSMYSFYDSLVSGSPGQQGEIAKYIMKYVGILYKLWNYVCLFKYLKRKQDNGKFKKKNLI